MTGLLKSTLRPIDDDVVSTLTRALEQRELTQEIAAAAARRGITHACFLGVGGSWASSVPISKMLQCDAQAFHTTNTNSAHFLHGYSESVDASTLVIASSHSGGTPETVAAAKLAADQGALVVSVARDTENELAAVADFALAYESDRTITSAKYHLLEELGYSLLDEVGCDLDIAEIRQSLDALPAAASGVVLDFEERSANAMSAMADAGSVLVVGGGRMGGLAYMLSVCYLIEMQWFPSINVDSGDFVHGPFEMVSPECAVIHLISEDALRPVDERIQKFLATHGSTVFTIDAETIRLPGVAERWRGRLSHIPMGLIVSRVAAHLESVTGHSLDLRRYMHKVQY